MRKTIVIATAVLLLAGCGQDATPQAAPSATASPAPSVTPTLVAATHDVPAAFAGWFAEDPSTLDLGKPEIFGNEVVGPGYQATIANVATRPEIAVDDVASLHLTAQAGTFPPAPAPGTRERVTLRAGSGREFVIAKTDGTLAKASVRVGTTSYPLGETAEDALLVVAAAPKTTVLLEVGDDGHRQALNMRTGLRHAEPGRYDTIVEQWNTTNRAAERIGNYAWVRAGGRIYAVVVQSYIVKRLPWIEGRGYAPKGKAWLSAEVHVQAGPVPGKGYDGDRAEVTLDPSRGLRIDGMAPISGSYRHEAGTYEFVVPVPARFTSGGLRMSVAGAKLTVNDKSKSFSVVQTAGSTTTMKLD
ncbi:hypothetical protein AB0F81_48040 [Actinoplanes sp. NPDC024001]|uniref:hypothetical protein n=1 Tax=Actinoplanes sp. NPDC024001 TaxID=3154598 RepID=UPI0033E12A61